jgi:ABC-2 type transport system permease protein
MSHAFAIAKKELRAFFLSPVALIFLGTFLFVTLFTFFWVEAFFSRNVADIRPLFEWLPLLLIFLVAAVTMRLWSEEQKLGTLEVLLTLPVRIEAMVLGKFLAGLALVALALALTLGLPLTVSQMGDLDWGPVMGGYVGALLLAAAYLAIGLCISSATDSQVVSLIGTIGAGAVLHALGSRPVTDFAGNRTGEILRALGTGSRFESIQRGVLDPRDLVYYLSLTTLFLALNVLVLHRKRWSAGERTRPQRRAALFAIVLVAGNLLLLNAWLAPLAPPRLDLTANREYSVSDTTRDLLRSLDSPLLVRGYFSAKTHPLLAPYVPRLRDLMAEYAALGRGKVKVEVIDPKENPALEEEANQSYGIKSFPFRVSDRYEAGIVNSYFSILVKYGDQYQVLNFDDLIEVAANNDKIEVRLRNPEYDLTRAIKKTVYGFQSIESIFADMSSPAKLTAFVTPKTLPENFQKAPELLAKVADDLKARSSGKFDWKTVDPSAPGSGLTPEKLFKDYGFRPFATSLLDQNVFYFHLLLEVDGKKLQVIPAEVASEADIRKELEAGLRRGAPGSMKRLGLVKPPSSSQADLPPELGGRRGGSDTTRMLREALAGSWEVRDLSLANGRVPGEIDVLLLVGPKDLDEKSRFAVDQFLMRGGTVVVLGGHYRMASAGGGEESLSVEKVSTGLEPELASWGVKLEDSMVLDMQNEPFPVPVMRDLGFMKVREIQLVHYPFFVDVRRDGMSPDNPILAGLPNVVLQWATPLAVDAAKKDGKEPLREVVTLLRSTPESWTTTSTDIQPDFRRFPELGFAKQEAGLSSQTLAVAVKGKFKSFFADKPSPIWGEEGGGEGDRTGRTVKESPDTARLVVVGSSSFIDDQMIGLSRQASTEGGVNNLRFVQNILDWAVEDVDLLKIRSRGSFARTLVSMKPGERAFWEWLNYGLVLLALGALVGLTILWRRRIRPIALDPKKTETPDNDDFRPRGGSIEEQTA